ncbi:MAG: class I SAM-dependent methyltransferase [Candidatus Bathycorpusculaceae bacterium]
MLERTWVDEKAGKLNLNDVKERFRERVEKFKRYEFYVEGRVLDVGTGGGIDLLALFSINPKIEAVGVDLSRKALEFAKGILPKDSAHFVVADATYLPFRGCSFDAINVSYMLHHHPLKFLQRILQGLSVLLKNGGIMLIEEPSVESESGALREEIETLRFDLEIYSKIRKQIMSEELRCYLYDLAPIFNYGTTYPSLLKKAIEENHFKIELFEVKVKKSNSGNAETEMLNDIEEKIRRSGIPDYEKAFLLEKVDAIREKLKLIELGGQKSVILRVKKPFNRE